MKRMMAILVLVVAVPAMAVVNFTATDAGNGKLQIAYTTTDGDLPRGVALRISLSDGAVVDTSPTATLFVDGAFNTFIDWAYSNPLNPPYTVGAGHPLAKATEAGALAADASIFSVSMGVLDQTGAQKAGPATSANLITIQLKGTADTTVTIEGDTLRGPASGVVGSVLNSNLPLMPKPVVKLGIVDCVKSTAPFYADWLAWGKPACWCFERQCRGDINGKNDGVAVKYWVSGTDLGLFKLAYAKSDADLRNVVGGICSDLNHKADGVAVKYRASGTDLGIFKLYYAKAVGSVPVCELAPNYNFWLLP